MDSHDALRKLRKHLTAERAAQLEALLTATNIERVRGRILQIDEISGKLAELLHTKGDSDGD